MALISEQVKILLERMDLYPDEFVRPFESRRLETKWYEVLREGHFNKVEWFLITRKFNKLKRKATQEMIMQTIMHEEPTSEEETYRFDTVSRAYNTTTVNTLMNHPRMRIKQP